MLIYSSTVFIQRIICLLLSYLNGNSIFLLFANSTSRRLTTEFIKNLEIKYSNSPYVQMDELNIWNFQLCDRGDWLSILWNFSYFLIHWKSILIAEIEINWDQIDHAVFLINLFT